MIRRLTFGPGPGVSGAVLVVLLAAGAEAQDAAVAADAGVPAVEQAAADLLPREMWPEMSITAAPGDGVMVGDLVTLTITAQGREGDDIAVPRQDFAPFEVHSTDLAEEPASGGGKKYTFTIALLAFEPGEHTVGPVRLRVVTADGTIGRVETDTVAVNVGSLLGNEPDAQPKPDTQPVPVMEEDYTLAWIAGGFGAALVLALIMFFVARWWAKRERPAPPPAPPRPAWDVAMEKLEALRRTLPERIASGGMDEWADQLSDVIREYLGARFEFEGLESTTDEVVARMRKLAPAGVQVEEVAAILGDCDLVKFAKASADESQCAQMLDAVFKMVQRTRPTFAETSGAAAPAGAQPTGGAA